MPKPKSANELIDKSISKFGYVSRTSLRKMRLTNNQIRNVMTNGVARRKDLERSLDNKGLVKFSLKEVEHTAQPSLEESVIDFAKKNPGYTTSDIIEEFGDVHGKDAVVDTMVELAHKKVIPYPTIAVLGKSEQVEHEEFESTGTNFNFFINNYQELFNDFIEYKMKSVDINEFFEFVKEVL